LRAKDPSLRPALRAQTSFSGSNYLISSVTASRDPSSILSGSAQDDARAFSASVTWPLCEPCASGTPGRTFWSPGGRNASSYFLWWCNSGSCTHHTVT
jgi:hypothetical protein